MPDDVYVGVGIGMVFLIFGIMTVLLIMTDRKKNRDE